MDSKRAIAGFFALANDARLNVFRLLVKAGDEGVPAGDIAVRLSLQPSTLSSHLRTLEGAGLIMSEREGRIIRYRADFTGMRDLLAFLMEDCCNGNPDLCRPVIEAVTCEC